MHEVAAPLELPSLGAVARRTVPHLLEATILPALLLYVVLVRFGTGAAMVATPAWSYTALVRRLARRERVPAILLLALGGLTARTAAGVVSGSAAMYFVQPVVTNRSPPSGRHGSHCDRTSAPRRVRSLRRLGSATLRRRSPVRIGLRTQPLGSCRQRAVWSRSAVGSAEPFAR